MGRLQDRCESLNTFRLILVPNIETASHKFVTMKYFAKIDLKSAHNQIEID